MKLSPVTAAQQFIEEFYPDCKTALLCGSVATGQETEHSDLDLIIISEKEKNITKKCEIKYGWPIEALIYNEESFSFFFGRDSLLGNPYLPRMCSYSIILNGEEAGVEIRKRALEVIRAGPSEWSDIQKKHSRYLITDTLDDLMASNDEAESLFIVNKLSELLADFILRVNNHWTGEGKWTLRSLKKFDSQYARQFVEAFDSFYKTRNKNILISFVQSSLAPYGGELFEGYVEE